jgi:hypothetical protein
MELGTSTHLAVESTWIDEIEATVRARGVHGIFSTGMAIRLLLLIPKRFGDVMVVDGSWNLARGTVNSCRSGRALKNGRVA